MSCAVGQIEEGKCEGTPTADISLSCAILDARSKFRWSAFTSIVLLGVDDIDMVIITLRHSIIDGR